VVRLWCGVQGKVGVGRGGALKTISNFKTKFKLPFLSISLALAQFLLSSEVNIETHSSLDFKGRLDASSAISKRVSAISC